MAIFGNRINSSEPGSAADIREKILKAPKGKKGFIKLEIKKKAVIEPFLAMNSDSQDNETKQVRLLDGIITKLLKEQDKKNIAAANAISRFIELYEKNFNDPSHSSIFFEEDLKELLNELSQMEP